MVVLSPYAGYSRGSSQYEWLERDLAAFDRQRTPWLLVSFHAPWYNTVAAHYQVRRWAAAQGLGLDFRPSTDPGGTPHRYALPLVNVDSSGALLCGGQVQVSGLSVHDVQP